MADLASLKVADDLKILVKIPYIGDAPVPVKVLCDREEVWLSRQAIEAAEHIPAPRVFKRGDWVRRGTRRHGLVYRRDEVDRVWVSWPVTSGSETVESERISTLEPDEAPE